MQLYHACCVKHIASVASVSLKNSSIERKEIRVWVIQGPKTVAQEYAPVHPLKHIWEFL